MIKLIVSDMDGTLIRHDSSISKENIEAIKYAQEKGIQFVIATGRDYSGIKRFLDCYNLQCYSILGNGAQFVNEDGKVLSSAYFPKHRFKEVLKIFDDLKIHYMIFTASGFYSTEEPNIICDAFINRCIVKFKRSREDYSEGGSNHGMPCTKLIKIDNVDDFINSSIDIIKIEAFDLNVNKITMAKEKLKDIEGITYLSSFDDNVEVTDKDAQKGLILQQVVNDLGLSNDEVMVLGDGLNDITMFELFKYSFAPKNANEKIKSLAYQVVDACEDNGVSQAIYMMIK